MFYQHNVWFLSQRYWLSRTSSENKHDGAHFKTFLHYWKKKKTGLDFETSGLSLLSKNSLGVYSFTGICTVFLVSNNTSAFIWTVLLLLFVNNLFLMHKYICTIYIFFNWHIPLDIFSILHCNFALIAQYVVIQFFMDYIFIFVWIYMPCLPVSLLQCICLRAQLAAVISYYSCSSSCFYYNYSYCGLTELYLHKRKKLQIYI